MLDADVLLDKPGRHDAGVRTHRCALLDRTRIWTHFLVAGERHRRAPIGVVTLEAASLQDRSDVLRVGDLLGSALALSRRLRSRGDSRDSDRGDDHPDAYGDARQTFARH